MPRDASGSIVALDVGAARIGVAIASSTAKIARPLVTLANDDSIFSSLRVLFERERVTALCVGLPRGLDGQHTAQTAVAEAFAAELTKRLAVPVYLQDEAVTSKQAEAELQARGKPYAKGEIDALAATYILEDFIHDHPEVLHT